MKSVGELLKWKLIVPLLFWGAMFRLYKTQVLAENRMIRYNLGVRYFGEGRT